MSPLVSFCVMFHNQASFVEQVLAGAFKQTYPNMEIVISDDASTDGTSEKIVRCIDQYRADGGPRTVIYERNSAALGMLGNREHVYTMAHGELLVNADGDDVSLPDRVATLVKAWVDGGKNATVLGSEAIAVDENNRLLGVTHQNGNPMGAMLALKASILRHFKPVCNDAAYHAHDDLVYDMRARMFGERLYVNRHLLLYRYGTGESSGGQFRKRMVRGFTGFVSGLRQTLMDLDTVKDVIPVERYFELKKFAESEIARCSMVLPLWSSCRAVERWRSFRYARSDHKGIKSFAVETLLLFPPCVGDLFFFFFGKLILFRRRWVARSLELEALTKYVRITKGKAVELC